MTADNRIKYFLAALWGAAIVLLLGGRIAYEITGTPVFGYVSMAYIIIVNLTAATLLIVIIVRLKEWIERQAAAIAGRKSAVPEHEAGLQALRQSVERLEARVNEIEDARNKAAE